MAHVIFFLQSRQFIEFNKIGSTQKGSKSGDMNFGRKSRKLHFLEN